MGITLFVAGAIIEAGFTYFCVITKSGQIRAKGTLRLGVLAAFLLLTVLSVLKWSFRYYALLAFLVALALFGTVSLFLKGSSKREYTARHFVARAILMTGLIFIFTLPAILFPQYTPLSPTGHFKVATAFYTYTDTNRIETYTDTGENRKLNVEFWYPLGADGTYPLIVFSHGSLGVKTSNETLFSELASHGYVVCSIDHTYQCFFTTGEDGRTTLLDMGFFNELSSELNTLDKQQSYACYQKWMKIRMDDIDFVLDHILAESGNTSAGTACRLVDKTKIGVMGHSLGGSAALGIGRIRSDIQAVVALESPFMYDIKGVKDDTFVFATGNYTIPLLNIYSDDSWSHLGQWPEYKENNALLNDPGAYNVHICGVGHLSLTDLSLVSPILTDMLNGHSSLTDAGSCLQTINKYCLAFFDYALKGAGTFPPGTYEK